MASDLVICESCLAFLCLSSLLVAVGRIKCVDVLKLLVQHLVYNWCLINCHGDDGSSGG